MIGCKNLQSNLEQHTINVDKGVRFLFQKDIYIQENDCGQRRVNQIQTLYADIDLKRENITKDLVINFTEHNSAFRQKIIYNQSTFRYEDLFSSSPHYEYELPECEPLKSHCSFGFSVFLNQNVLQKKDWLIDLTITEPFGKNTIHNSNRLPMENLSTQDDANYLFKDLHMSHDQEYKKTWVTIDKNKIKRLIDKGFKIEFIFSWRSSKKQIGYTEHAKMIKTEDLWLRNKTPYYELTNVPKNITYLSFMIHAQNKSNAFESKIEILDKNNPFYECGP